MFVKRRKVANFNNNSFLGNSNYENGGDAGKIAAAAKTRCGKHKDCAGNVSPEVRRVPVPLL